MKLVGRGEVEDGEVNTEFTLRRSHVYKWFSAMELFPEVCHFFPFDLRVLFHMWLVGAPHIWSILQGKKIKITRKIRSKTLWGVWTREMVNRG